MPCDQISPNPLEEAESPNLQQLEIEDGALDGESKICCARTPAQYAALFKLILKRQEEVKKLADVLGSRGKDVDGEFGEGGDGSSVGSPAVSAVSAHLLTKPTAPQFTDEEGNVLQQWKSPSESPVSHVRQGLKFHDSKIYVQSAGLYFVYCQILYNRATGDHHDYPALASNYVKRHSVLYPASSGILLKARHTRMSGENDRHSSYVGGLFFLHAGDQLFVQVAVPELVSHDDKASFFGLFKVGN
ncbi:CD40 ligand-like [Littorina saxatilis]